MPNRVVLYGKPGCHLCELAYDLVRGVANTQELVIEKVDITLDASLLEKYHDRIPVLVINDTITLYAPIRTAAVKEAFASP